MGEALVPIMINKGWHVIGIARRFDKLQSLQTEFGSQNFTPYCCDVSLLDEIKKTSDQIKKSGLTPTLFFLNAGGGWLEEIEKFDVNLHRKTFDVNYFGAIAWIDQWLPELEKKEITFVGISSLVAYHPTPAAAYCASKAALRSCFKSLQLQYHNTPVRFITVFPGPVDTAMLKSDKKLPFTWTAEKAADYITQRVFKNEKNIAFPLFWSLFFKTLQFIPHKWAAKILSS